MTELDQATAKIRAGGPVVVLTKSFTAGDFYQCKECGDWTREEDPLCIYCYEEGYRWCEICHNVGRSFKAEDVVGTTVYICPKCQEEYHEEV